MRKSLTGRDGWVALVALLVAALIVGCGSGEGSPDSPQTDATPVIIIVADSLRADHLWFNGYDEPTSPFLDWVSEEGLVFERAYANSSFTAQSVTSLMTGRLPTSAGSVGLDSQPPAAAITLPRVFRRAGYRTGIVSSQPLLARRGFTRGFQDIQIDSEPGRWSGEELSRRALDFIDTVSDEPFLLYVQYLDPHQPHTRADFRDRIKATNYWPVRRAALGPDSDLARGRWPDAVESELVEVVTSYDAEVAYTDNAIRLLVAGLRNRGLWERALVIITSSSGEELMERAHVGAARTLHEEVLRVPLLIHGPGVPQGENVSQLVSLVDVLPTLATVGALPVDDLAFDGHSFLAPTDRQLRPVARGGPVIAELVLPERTIQRAVISGGWKYIRTHENPGSAKVGASSAEDAPTSPELWGEIIAERLFRLESDPYERVDQLETAAEIVGDLRAILDRYAAYCSRNALSPYLARGPAEQVDPKEIDRLEALGYL